MQASVDIPALKKALTVTKPAIGNRPGYLPVLAGARLQATGNRLLIAATNLNLTVQTSVEADVIEAGVVVASHKLLSDLVKGKGTIELKSDDEDLVAINGSTTRIRTFPAEDYPRLPEAIGWGRHYSLDTAVLAKVLIAASTDDNRPTLTGVLFNHNGEVVATDSYRLHIAQTDVDWPDLLIPARALAPAVKIGGTVTMLVSDDNQSVRLTNGNVAWTTRVVDSSFPNYAQLVPAGYPNRWRTGRDELIAAVDHVRIMVRDNTTPVRIQLDPLATRAPLTVITPELGQTISEVNGRYDGTELTVAFNPTYLRDCLSVGTTTQVELQVLDALKPACWRDVNPDGTTDHTSLRLLMPVRVS